ncbi:UDP-glucoronosyl and UDP-glucosyl transferase domain-containing protein [Ditylenchus destructor]|nr:UDP-glucoronosyl and UDP-glucosyl transferase domain-containing protein [Ditylenchus destructor]
MNQHYPGLNQLMPFNNYSQSPGFYLNYGQVVFIDKFPGKPNFSLGRFNVWLKKKFELAFLYANFKRALIKDKALIESLRAENFDAIFVEHLYPFGTALGQALGIRTHFLTNTMPLVEYLTDVFGIPLPTEYVPVVANVDFSDQMTILERAENIFQTWIISKLFHDYFDATTAIFRRHWDPNFGDLLEYMRRYV